jgi:hypothetical protein
MILSRFATFNTFNPLNSDGFSPVDPLSCVYTCSFCSFFFGGRIPGRTKFVLIPGSVVFACLIHFVVTQLPDRADFHGSFNCPPG